MTVTLNPQIEARLRERIAAEGGDADALVNSLLEDALEEVLTPEELASVRTGIRRGYAASQAGRERPLAEYEADVMRRRAERSAQAS